MTERVMLLGNIRAHLAFHVVQVLVPGRGLSFHRERETLVYSVMDSWEKNGAPALAGSECEVRRWAK
jgi:hypothetical protein